MGAVLNTVYNNYLAAYSPRQLTKYDTHKKSELRSVYNSIVKLNKMTYRIAGISQLSGFKKFRMANRYYGHMWNGYEIPEPEDEEYIYVTENGRVYHTNRECTHIRLSVRVVEATEALREYRPCEKCTDKIPHPTGGLLFFVSENGECYHSRRDCPGLKRTVQKIPKEEAFKYEVCSRCRGNNSKDR